MESAEGLASAVGRILSMHIRRHAEPTAVETLCLLTIATISVVWVLMKLVSVLVPLTFAIFLAFLVEPILAAFVLLPQNSRSLWRRARRRCEALNPAAPAALEASADAAAIVPGAGSRPDLGSPCSEKGTATGLHEKPSCLERLDRARSLPSRQAAVWLQHVWDIVAILLCVFLIFGIVYGVVAGIIEALTRFNWQQYEDSPRVQEIQKMMKLLGINTKEVLSGSLLQQYRGEVVSVALKAVGVLESVLLTLLLFFFALVATLPGVHQRRARSRMKCLMQRYLLCKTIASLIIAGAVTLSLWLMKVDLVLIFGIITFTLNYIPNIGSFFAILAPVPLVALQPHRGFVDVVMVAVVPFLVHNALGNIIEPKLMATGLDLHPLTVVVALTFWGSMWGIPGAILSVPITCAIRLWLEEIDHPYAKTLHQLFDAPMGSACKGSFQAPASPAAGLAPARARPAAREAKAPGDAEEAPGLRTPEEEA